MGFAFPKEEREWLVDAEPEKFMLPTGGEASGTSGCSSGLRRSMFPEMRELRLRRLADGGAQERCNHRRASRLGVKPIKIDTPFGVGEGRTCKRAAEPKAALVLGHGAGGGVNGAGSRRGGGGPLTQWA